MATNIPRSKVKDATKEVGINSSENKAGAVEMLFYISLNCERQQFVFYQPDSKNISGGAGGCLHESWDTVCSQNWIFRPVPTVQMRTSYSTALLWLRKLRIRGENVSPSMEWDRQRDDEMQNIMFFSCPSSSLLTSNWLSDSWLWIQSNRRNESPSAQLI